jgi:hypothetical protein
MCNKINFKLKNCLLPFFIIVNIITLNFIKCSTVNENDEISDLIRQYNLQLDKNNNNEQNSVVGVDVEAKNKALVKTKKHEKLNFKSHFFSLSKSEYQIDFINTTTTTTSPLTRLVTTTSSDLPPIAIESDDHSRSWTLFFILSILAFSILLIHVLITANFHFVPESLAVIFLGALIGLVLKLLSQWDISDWSVSNEKKNNKFKFSRRILI